MKSNEQFNSQTEFAEREVTRNGVTFVERNDYAITNCAFQVLEKGSRFLRLFLWHPEWSNKPEDNQEVEFCVTYDTGYGQTSRGFETLEEARKFFDEMLVPFSEYYVIQIFNRREDYDWVDFAGHKPTGRFTSVDQAKAFLKNYLNEDFGPFEFQYVVRRFYD